MEEDTSGPAIRADPQAYRRRICFVPRLALPGGLPEDKDLKASPLLQQVIERWKKGEDYY
jgi:hypothetical protein